MGLFPLEDVRTMVFELSLIRSAFGLVCFSQSTPAPWAGLLLSNNVRPLGGLAFVRGALARFNIYNYIY